MYVRPEHRKKGLYKRLYQHVRQLAKDSGASGIRLYADNDNARANKTVRPPHNETPDNVQALMAPAQMSWTSSETRAHNALMFRCCFTRQPKSAVLYVLLTIGSVRMQWCANANPCDKVQDPATKGLCMQYESLGMKTHYKVWEESFVGY